MLALNPSECQIVARAGLLAKPNAADGADIGADPRESRALLPALALLSRRLDLPMPGTGVSAALAHQAVIDAAPCSALDGEAPPADQHVAPRSQGAHCAAGTIDADCIFRRAPGLTAAGTHPG